MIGRAKRVLRRRWRAAGAALVLLAPAALAADASAADSESGDTPNPYSGFSDRELSDLGGRWESLGDDERRWLFIETRKRMVANGQPVQLPVRARARFGRVLRDADGSLLRLESLHIVDTVEGRQRAAATQAPATVRAGSREGLTPPDADAEVADQFGTGFEQRRTETEDAPEADGDAAGSPASRPRQRRDDRRS